MYVALPFASGEASIDTNLSLIGQNKKWNFCLQIELSMLSYIPKRIEDF